MDASSLAAPIVVQQDTHKLPAAVGASGVEASHVDDDDDDVGSLCLTPSSNSHEEAVLCVPREVNIYIASLPCLLMR